MYETIIHSLGKMWRLLVASSGSAKGLLHWFHSRFSRTRDPEASLTRLDCSPGEWGSFH